MKLHGTSILEVSVEGFYIQKLRFLIFLQKNNIDLLMPFYTDTLKVTLPGSRQFPRRGPGSLATLRGASQPGAVFFQMVARWVEIPDFGIRTWDLPPDSPFERVDAEGHR